MDKITDSELEQIKKAVEKINNLSLKNTNVKLDYLDKKLGAIIDLLSDIKILLGGLPPNQQ